MLNVQREPNLKPLSEVLQGRFKHSHCSMEQLAGLT